jgi:uncharacterized protein
MSKKEEFKSHIVSGYACKGESINLGAAMIDGEPVLGADVKVPLKMLNRHGLIAGATGTGKTKTLQVLSEQMSDFGIPVLLMDVKGDLSGIAMPSEEKSFITERHAKIGIPHQTSGYPVELLTLSEQNGVRLRATVSEFGPVLFSRILELNDTQAGIVAMIFKYCDDRKMPLLDLKDMKKVIQFITEEGKEELEREYGKIATSSTGTILRKIIELEQQGADLFFGEMSFEISDLMRFDEKGRGIISVLRLTDVQDKPKLFSTFMLSLLAEIYSQMPERGDADRPELIVFIDEAHLIFNEASSALLAQIENIVKLIRSKGIGIYFVTQNPADIPNGVLGQLGLKVQHALRAFTAQDRKDIKLAAENYPLSPYYKTDEALTTLGIGEAFVTVLSEKGIPTPLAATMLRAPQSRMDILTNDEINGINSRSKLVKKYGEAVDRESAYEMLSAKIIASEQQAQMQVQRAQMEKEAAREAKFNTSESHRNSGPDPLMKVLTNPSFIRGVFGILSKVMK